MSLSRNKTARKLSVKMKLNYDTWIGITLGASVLGYSLINLFKKKEAQIPNITRRYTLEQLESFNGDGFKACYVALDDAIYDVSTEKKRFIEAGLGGKCLNRSDKPGFLVENFILIGLSKQDIKLKFPQVGILLILRDFSVEELRQYDGSGENPAYICAKGMVFDVDKNFYGPDAPYGAFAGRDASRALAKVSLEKADLENSNIDDLTFSERHTLEEWVAKFEMKYTKVGYMKKV